MEHCLLNCPILHRLRPGAAGSDAKLNLMVELEQKNYEPRDENIQLNGINTVCLRREWCFNVFTGLAHKYLWSVHSEGECRAPEQRTAVVRRGAEGEQTHLTLCPAGSGDGHPSDSSPVTLPRHPRSLQNSKVCCVVRQRLLGAQEGTDNPGQGREPPGDAGPFLVQCSHPAPEFYPAQTALCGGPSAQGPKVSHLF